MGQAKPLKYLYNAEWDFAILTVSNHREQITRWFYITKSSNVKFIKLKQ